ncbi:uncharacterized protein BDZ99DRAFT_92929 [Mytilinidion resinicola]|uniref:Uncharacterized protein n=1 Tax=Mytilinidion resinicola TaxID=574789 RepID=A0A6A6YBR1_9PEZI|nr:uncharacterized protein BDZ99DRAFT_92929 [Mytilinidion resinicola]KAF2806252.1 hypothetical protein BDZ99DRAFT_92929 [Mytilinidion resinicola]
MPLFWKRNSFTLFVKGRDSRLAIGFIPPPLPRTQPNGKPVQHLRLFSSLDTEYTKLIRHWSLSFDTGYSGNTEQTVTQEKAVWDKAKRVMPLRITEHPLASQYLQHRFITKIATCETDAQSKLSYKQSAFAHLCGLLDTLKFAPTFRYLDLGVGENPGPDLTKKSFPAERCQHVYMYKSVEYKAGEELLKLLPQLLQARTPPIPGSREDRAWDWLQLEGST